MTEDEAHLSTSNDGSFGYVQEMKSGVETRWFRINKKWLKME